MNELKVFQDARKLISNKSNWTTEFYFVDKKGNPCEVGEANKYCAMGAFEASIVNNGLVGQNLENLKSRLFNKFVELYQRTPIIVNDGPNGYPKVIAVYDSIITDLEKTNVQG